MSYEIIGTQTPDKLIGGVEVELLTKIVTLASGQGTLKRGSVIGLIELAAGAPVAGTNTGNGTVSDVALTAKSKKGNYKIVCTSKVTNAGVFAVYDPDGNRLKDATVGVAYAEAQIHFTINDGATDFEVNDSFTIPVNAGSGKGKLCVKTAVDGSQIAKYILVEETDTTADAPATCYKAGIFNRDALTFGGSDTAADHEAELRAAGIELREAL